MNRDPLDPNIEPISRWLWLVWALWIGILGVLRGAGIDATGWISDALIPVHVSQIHWTPYYWGQARFGMLTPGLVSFIEEPVINFASQVLLQTIFGSAGIALTGFLVLRGQKALLAGALSLGLYLLLFDETSEFVFGPTSQISPGLFLGVVGILALVRPHPRSHFWAVPILMLAYWVDISNLLLLPILLLSTILADSRNTGSRTNLRYALTRQFLPNLVIVLLTAFPAVTLSVLTQSGETGDLFRFSTPKIWLSSAAAMGQDLSLFSPAFFLALGALGLSLLLHKRLATRAVWIFFVIGLARVSLVLPLGWVGQNNAHMKYYLVALVFVAGIPSVMVASLIPVRTKLGPWILCAMLVTLIGSLVVWQPYSPSMIRRALRADVVTLAFKKFAAARCQYIAGEDEGVWPALFAWRQLHAEGVNVPPLPVPISRRTPPKPLKPPKGSRVCARASTSNMNYLVELKLQGVLPNPERSRVAGDLQIWEY